MIGLVTRGARALLSRGEMLSILVERGDYALSLWINSKIWGGKACVESVAHYTHDKVPSPAFENYRPLANRWNQL